MELEPKNEKGVSYLFSIYHKELGFPEIIEFIDTTPDLTARRAKDNKIVGIELEFKASSAEFLSTKRRYAQEFNWSYK